MNLTKTEIKVMVASLKALESRDYLTVEERNLLDKLNTFLEK